MENKLTFTLGTVGSVVIDLSDSTPMYEITFKGETIRNSCLLFAMQALGLGVPSQSLVLNAVLKDLGTRALLTQQVLTTEL